VTTLEPWVLNIFYQSQTPSMPYASKHMPKLYQSGGSSYAKHDAKARELGWFGVWGGLATGRCGF
jgi:hypothetical protein